jgi:hypothetical protein
VWHELNNALDSAHASNMPGTTMPALRTAVNGRPTGGPNPEPYSDDGCMNVGGMPLQPSADQENRLTRTRARPSLLCARYRVWLCRKATRRLCPTEQKA